MKQTIAFSSLVFLAAISSAAAQTVTDPAPSFHIGFGEVILTSNFAAPQNQESKGEPSAKIGFSVEKPSWYIDGFAQLAYRGLETLNMSGRAGSSIGSIKRASTFLGTRYLFSSQDETILNNAPVLMTGLVRKQVLLFDVSEVFSLAKTRFQLSYLVGGVELTDKITIRVDGRQINAGEESIHENIQFSPERKWAQGFGISAAVQPTKKLSLSANGEKLYLMENPTKLMSTRQYRVQLSAAYRLTRWFGLELEDSITDIAQPSALGSRGISTQMVIKF